MHALQVPAALENGQVAPNRLAGHVELRGELGDRGAPCDAHLLGDGLLSLLGVHTGSVLIVPAHSATP